jgi:deoxyribose-phosphate aldolase
LEPDRGLEGFDRFCDECLEYELAAACVPVFWVKRAVARLGAKVPVSGVVAFPRGLEGTNAKVAAVRQCMAEGARELDVVGTWTAIKCGEPDEALRDARAVVEAARAENPDVYIKLIPEIPELTREEKLLACDMVARSGADCLKTQAAGRKETTLDDVRLVRGALPDHVQVKASISEVRNVADVECLIALGATRIGTDYPVEIAREWRGLQPALSAGLRLDMLGAAAVLRGRPQGDAQQRGQISLVSGLRFELRAPPA